MSEVNKFYISYERQLELEHYCKQVPEWQEELSSLTEVKAAQWYEDYVIAKGGEVKDPTYAFAIRKVMLEVRIKNILDLIDKVAEMYGEDKKEIYIYREILDKSIIDGIGYYAMQGIEETVSLTKYRTMMRHFFWLLDKRRD